MAVTSALTFGPTMRPGFAVNSVTFFDDFLFLNIGTDGTSGWVNNNDSGTALLSAAEPNGVLAIDSGSDAGNDAVLQLHGEPFAFDWSRDMFMEVRLKTASIATNTSVWFVGLCTEGGPDISGGDFAAEHVGISGLGDGSVEGTSSDGTTQSTVDTTSDLAADTYSVVSMKWSAQEQALRWYVDGVRKATKKVGADSWNVPSDGEQLTPTIVSEFAAGSGSVVNVDYILITQQRS